MDFTKTELDASERGSTFPFEDDREYWSFEGRSEREFSHAFLQYPAMMVPQMQGEIIDHILKEFPKTKHVWDPFVGSGTSLGETMLRGLDFSGNDINPLAVLVSKTKRGPLNVAALNGKMENLFSRIAEDPSDQVEVNFSGIEKWFSTEAAVALSKIRRCVCQEDSLWARRFFWVAFAETIRLTSNSRTSTYKLHIRSAENLSKERKSPISVFTSILENNFRHLRAFKEQLEKRKLLSGGWYKGETTISLCNTIELPKTFIPSNNADLIITSPPYGDNQTTIPYGQYSFLPLNWIPLEDIDENISPDCIESTSAIDTMSLGGSRKNAMKKAEKLLDLSPTFKKLLGDLEKKPDDAKKKVAAFFSDLNTCIPPMLKRLGQGGNMVWTLGNRRVANIEVPLDQILLELLENQGVKFKTQFERGIPTKRMAGRNSVSTTMVTETIMVLQKPLLKK